MESPLLFKKRINSDVETLELLHKEYDWIPGKSNIRPLKEVIEAKQNYFNNIERDYKSLKDYVLIEIFKKNCRMINGKLENVEIISNELTFIPNKFPYNISNDTNHYILWYSFNDGLSDELITKDINDEITKLVHNDNFEFVWYENPKMNIPDVFHVQVFWKKV